MGPKTEAINLRVESGIANRLRVLADQNHRGVSDELRAGIEIYLLLVELTNVRADVRIEAAKAIEIERAIKEEIGRIFLVALSPDAENMFETDLGVEYPKNTFKEIAVPFDRLLDWVSGIPVGPPPTNSELIAEAKSWSDSVPIIEAQNRPSTEKLRSWAKALEATEDPTATLSRVQQALRITAS
jgi:hypothetical protein